MTLSFAQPSLPELYEQELVKPLFRPFAELILDEVQLAPGDRLLDVACGTGIVARLAKERLSETGKVVGVDLSPAMLAVARRFDGIDWREGDAAALPLGNDEQFDIVVSQQGFQFFPDRAAAAREMHRALAPGGRLGVETWRSDEEVPFGRELRRIAERHVGPIVDRRHSFGDAEALEKLLRDAGFLDVRSKTVSRTIRFADGSVFVRLNAMALVGMSAAKEVGDEERARLLAAITQDSADLLREYTRDSGLVFEFGTNVATAKGGVRS